MVHSQYIQRYPNHSQTSQITKVKKNSPQRDKYVCAQFQHALIFESLTCTQYNVGIAELRNNKNDCVMEHAGSHVFDGGVSWVACML